MKVSRKEFKEYVEIAVCRRRGNGSVIHREHKSVSALDTYLDVFDKSYNLFNGIGL